MKPVNKDKKKGPMTMNKTESKALLGKHSNNPSMASKRESMQTQRSTLKESATTANLHVKKPEGFGLISNQNTIVNHTNNQTEEDVESQMENTSFRKRDRDKETNREPESVSPSRRQTISHFPNAPVDLSSISGNTQIKVIARFRPLNQVELELSMKNMGTICAKFNSEDTVTVTNNSNSPCTVTLDRVFDMNTSQKQLYDQVAKSTIDDVMRGYNGTIFTYGQSGSGKTFSMYGEDLYEENGKGIIPRAIQEIFDFINDENNKEIKFELKFSMLEIYKENLHDLLSPDTKPSELKIKEHPRKGIYVANLTEEYISSEEEFLMLIENADDYRVKAETGLNKASSRSHMLFQLEIIQKLPDDTERRGMLNLVDLAGSEKVAKTHAVGETLEEAKKINLSLSTLGNVISALTSNRSDFVPYRDSKLTRILQDSLGGNYKTTLIVTCSPHVYNCEETISTLKFAQRAKKIKNKVKLNIKRSVEQLEAIIEALTKQLALSNEEINRLKLLCNANNILISPVSSIIPTVDGPFTGTDQQFFNFNLNNSTTQQSTGNNNITLQIPSRGDSKVNQENADKYLNIIKQKDDEILALNDKIETLQDENKSLEEKIRKISKETGYVYFYQILENLENFTKKNIEEVKTLKYEADKSKLEDIKSENEKLRLNYKILESKYLQSLKEIEKKLKQDDKIEMNFEEELSKNQINFVNFFEKQEDKKRLTNSYQNIYESSKLYLGTILKDFLKKRDLFGAKFGIEPFPKDSKDAKNNNTHAQLKNTFMKMSLLLVYYEKVVFDLMNRVMVDLKRLEVKDRNRVNIEQKCENFNKSLIMYLEILEDMKEMKEMKIKKENEEKKVQEEIRENEAGRGLFAMKEVEEVKETSEPISHFIDKRDSTDIEEKKRNRFENNFNFLKSMNLINQETPQTKLSQNGVSNQQSANDTDKKHTNTNIVKPVDKKKSTKLLNNLNLLVNRLAHVEGFSNTFAGNNTNNATSVIETNPFRLQLNKCEDKDPDINLIPTTSNSNNLMSLSIFNKDKAFNKRRDLNWLKESIVSTTAKLYGINTNPISTSIAKEASDLSLELKNVKKELKLYKTSVENFSSEIEMLKIKTLQTDNAIVEFQENQKKLMEYEVQNFMHVLNIYKRLYDEEMKSKRAVIEELGKIVDEVYFNTNGVVNTNNSLSVSQGSHRAQSLSIPNIKGNNIFSNYINTYNSMNTSTRSIKPVVHDYLEYKKDKLLTGHSIDDPFQANSTVMKIAEAILRDGGTATKKLDYILFQIEDNFENLRVEYGSGLHSMIPSKSPLYRNLKLSFIGDTHSDVESPDIDD